MPVLRSIQRLVSEVQERGRRLAVHRLQQVRQADEEPPRQTGVLQLHQVQPPRRHKPPQQPSERGDGRNGAAGAVRRLEETIASDEGHEELPIAGRQREGVRAHVHASPSAFESLEGTAGRSGFGAPETTRESPPRRGQQVLSRVRARRSRLPPPLPRENLRSDCQIYIR